MSSKEPYSGEGSISRPSTIASSSPTGATTSGTAAPNVVRTIQHPVPKNEAQKDFLQHLEDLGIVPPPELPEIPIRLQDLPRHTSEFPNFMHSNFRAKYTDPQKLAERPKGFTTTGREVVVKINAFPVTKWPLKKVFQYDVIIGSGAEKRGFNMALWESITAKKAFGPGWIFDGNKQAWCSRDIGQMNITVDMDVERGRPPNTKDPRGNTFRIQVRTVKEVRFDVLNGYLGKRCDFSNEVTEAINFMDHLLRHTPSTEMVGIKRSFFPKDMNECRNLLGHVMAAKGVYQSIRMAQGANLFVNVDVANQCFWCPGTLYTAILELAAPTQEPQVIINMQKPAAGFETVCYRQVMKLKKVRFTVEYPNMPERLKGKVFVVENILRTNSRNTKFGYQEKDSEETREITVIDYFKRVYGVHLDHPGMPIIQAGGKMKPMYPSEFCFLVPAQKYPFKLSEMQTSGMIKFAVTKPSVRAKAIQDGLNALNWENDQMLKGYGLEMKTSMLTTKARLLNPPEVEFGGGKKEKPGYAGRWRIDNKQFIRPNKNPLKTWGLMLFNDWGHRDKVSDAETIKFMRELMGFFKAYGGTIATDAPQNPMQPAGGIQYGNVSDIKGSIEKMYLKAGNTQKSKPQLLIFIVNAKNTHYYNQIKKECDTRFGVASQVMQSAHVKKCQAQYMGNVLMKVFAKLGGFSFKATPAGYETKKNGGKAHSWFSVPTIMMGCDVSHAAAGSFAPSMASVTVSMDRVGCRYWAGVQSNGRRKEMVSTWNMFEMLTPIYREWMANVGGGRFPEHIIYFRDGVSDPQYQHVLQQEVRDIRAIWHKLDETPNKALANRIKYTIVVASKRHHIRFFPNPGPGSDRNLNPHPGTIVEKDVTHPHQYDFYLCSHSAIQGTARPVHYHVLIDEKKIPVNDFVNMVYSHSYQYARSSTPVSIHPAIYYAHLAAKRAVAHDAVTIHEEHPYSTSDQLRLANLQAVRANCDRTGKVMHDEARAALKALENMDAPPLTPLGPSSDSRGGDPERFKFTSMWFI